MLPLAGSINQATDALKRLLDGLLDISKLDAGAVTPKVTVFSADTLIRRLGAEYAHRAERQGLRLRIVGLLVLGPQRSGPAGAHPAQPDRERAALHDPWPHPGRLPPGFRRPPDRCPGYRDRHPARSGRSDLRGIPSDRYLGRCPDGGQGAGLGLADRAAAGGPARSPRLGPVSPPAMARASRSKCRWRRCLAAGAVAVGISVEKRPVRMPAGSIADPRRRGDHPDGSQGAAGKLGLSGAFGHVDWTKRSSGSPAGPGCRPDHRRLPPGRRQYRAGGDRGDPRDRRAPDTRHRPDRRYRPRHPRAGRAGRASASCTSRSPPTTCARIVLDCAGSERSGRVRCRLRPPR